MGRYGTSNERDRVGALTSISSVSSRWNALERFVPQGARRLAGSLWVTLAGQAMMLCGLFLVTRISVHVFGAEGFGQYQVARRTLAVVAFPLMCGLGISLPRYVARDIGNAREVTKWMISSLVFGAMLVAAVLGVGFLASSSIGKWVFGTTGERTLVLALILATAGMFCATLAIAALRGLSRFHYAALLQVVNGAIVPLVALISAEGQVARALVMSGIVWIAIAGLVFVRLGREWECHLPGMGSIAKAVKELFVFGVPRVPGDVALFGLFALPAYAAVLRHDIVRAGFLSVGLSLVQAIATAFASAGFVLLPYWSRATKSSESLVIARRRTLKLLIASGIVSTFCLALLEAFLLPVARVLLGPLATAGLHDMRFVTLAAVPYVLYLVLRDYFDALTVFPLNTVALATAVLTQLVLLRDQSLSLSVATAASFSVLGLTMVALWAIPLRWVGAKAN